MVTSVAGSRTRRGPSRGFRPAPPALSGRRPAAGTALTAAALIVLAGCASQDGTGQTPASGSPAQSSGGAPSSGAPGPGNGTAFATLWGEAETKVTAYPVTADGSFAEGTVIVSGPFDGKAFTNVVDGLGDLVLTGAFEDYWSTEVTLRRGDEELVTTKAAGWCGGEDLSAICHLLDEERLVRTTVLGDDEKDPKILVSSLASGETLKEFGPFKDLTMIVPTASPDSIITVTTPTDASGDPSGGSTVERLDLTSGASSPIGDAPEGWAAICAVGSDSVLGFTQQGADWRASVVGPATVGEVTWSKDDTVSGCSADGRFLYVQRIPAPPTEEYDDTEGKNPPSNLERLTLADGQRTSVLTLQPEEVAALVSR